MKITYTPNPLSTIIELDEHEKEILRLKIKVNELEEHLGSASILLDPKNASWALKASARYPNGRTMEDVVNGMLGKELDLNLSYIYSTDEYEGKGLDERVEMLLEHYLGELQSSHSGDCTCFPASCSKCHAEEMLGINTIEGLSKHRAHKIERAFSYKDGDTWKQRSLDEVLAQFRCYDPKITDAGVDKNWSAESFASHVPRWKQEAAGALAWLEAYQKEHLTQHTQPEALVGR
jgi:hypothetical protein